MHSKVQIGQVMGIGMPMSSLAGLKIYKKGANVSLFDNARQISKNIGLWCKIPTYFTSAQIFLKESMPTAHIAHAQKLENVHTKI